MIHTLFQTVCSFRNCTLFLFFGSLGLAHAQLKTTVSGLIQDDFARPLANANIQLIRSDSSFLAISDGSGRFGLSVNPGRYWLKATYTGFAPFEEELLVIAGKSTSLKISLSETAQQLTDVEVSSGMPSEVPGSYAITIEKTMRLPANFFDPVRMATSLPGVVATNDQSNSISIKGYSPNAMLWRLQGLDIVNPNHLANAGTLSDKPVANGGGVSILSSQVLDRTNFYSGALPVQYGNALAGAMDMLLRPGSKTSREHTVQASLIGLDLATEGPMGKKNADGEADASYLVNYRYSTVGLLSQLGVNLGDEVINFQDLTFNLDFNHKKGGNLSVFGFGGLSSNRFDRKPEDEWETEKDRYNIDFTGKVFGTGFLSTSLIGSNGVLKTGLAISGQYQERSSVSAPVAVPHIQNEFFRNNRTLISALADFKKVTGKKFTWNLGGIMTTFRNDLASQTLGINSPPGAFNWNGKVNRSLLQSYIGSTWTLNKFWAVTSGLRFVYLTGSADSSVEPRLVFTRTLGKGQWNFSYGITSQMNQPQTLFANDNVGLNKTHQALVGYSHVFGNGIHLNSNAFFHYSWKIPVGFQTPDTVVYSVLNEFDGVELYNLRPVGVGRNYGLDVSLERRFTDKTYFQLAASWYRSEYKWHASQFLPTRFNGNFTSSINAGKEWSRSKKSFGIHTRLLYLGGLRQQSIDVVQSQFYGTTFYDVQSGFNHQLPNYFRIDLRASWRKNKPGYTRTISIDIQNLTNQQNPAYRYFDTHLQQVSQKNQLGLIPVLVYRVDF